MTSHTWAEPGPGVGLPRGRTRGGARRDHRLRAAAAVLAAAIGLAVAAPPAVGASDVPPGLEPPAGVERPSVDAQGVALWDPADERLLHGRDARHPRPMASLTKMLTSLLLVEHADSPAETITASARAASVGGATVGLRAGQQVPLPTLIAAMMVESGNDAAAAAAEHVAGSQRAFVELMAGRAEELGAGSASFINASGLTNDPAHHATPLGLARIATAAMAEPVIARYAATRSVDPAGLPRLVNRNELLGSYPGADGVKTGYTSAAGHSLAASATRGGWRLIAVVLDSSERFADAAEVLDWGFAAFDRAQAAEAGEAVATWRRAESGTAVVAGEAVGATVPTDSPAWLDLRLAPHVDGRVPAGAVLGRAHVRVDGEPVAAVPVTAAEPLAARKVEAPGPVAARLGRGLGEALRGMARAAPVRMRLPRQDGQHAQP